MPEIPQITLEYAFVSIIENIPRIQDHSDFTFAMKQIQAVYILLHKKLIRYTFSDNYNCLFNVAVLMWD